MKKRAINTDIGATIHAVALTNNMNEDVSDQLSDVGSTYEECVKSVILYGYTSYFRSIKIVTMTITDFKAV